jgi:nucleotide-binding universal stress UspA family protein
VPLTVDDLADHMNTTAPDEDTQQHREMSRALNTALEETTRRTGMLDAVTTTVTVSVGAGETSASLPYVRLASIGSATGPGGVFADVAAADPLAGIVPVPAGAAGTWQVTVTGKPWPSALQQSALDWAAHLYDVQRAQTQPVDDDEPVPSYALPNRVEELQRPYVLAGIA